MLRAESAARDAIKAGVDPPTILRYTVRARYRDKGGLDQWATVTLKAAPNSAQRLFIGVRDGAMSDTDLHLALGGSARLPFTDIQANRIKILRQTAYYFLATGFDVSIDTIEGPAVPAPGFIPNHMGVPLP
jgi:hypothetical protein